MTIADFEFTTIRKTYTAFIDGRAVVVHGVPFLEDPDTFEHHLDPQTSQRLYDLVRNPSTRVRSEGADVYNWDQQDRRMPLMIRFKGKAFQYGEMPIGHLALTINRVSDSVVPIARELATQKEFDPSKLDPAQIEPRVPYVGSGSLVVALDYPREALHALAEHTDEKFAQDSIRVLADALDWVARDFEGLPNSLGNPRVREVALRGLRRLIPKDIDSAVEVHGEFIGDPERRLELRKENRVAVQERLAEAISQATHREQIRVTGILNKPDVKGGFDLTDTDVELGHLHCVFDRTDPELLELVGSAFMKRVEVFGTILKKQRRSARVQVHGIEIAE